MYVFSKNNMHRKKTIQSPGTDHMLRVYGNKQKTNRKRQDNKKKNRRSYFDQEEYG